MRFVRKVLGDSAADQKLAEIKITDVLSMDPDFEKLRKQVRGLVHFLAMKYQLNAKDVSDIVLEQLFD